MSSLPKFSGQRILITGATGSIGGAIAMHLAQAGARPVLSGRNAEKLEQMVAAIPNAEIAPYDLINAEGISEWLRALVEKSGPFSGIAHMAGIHNMRPIRMTDAALINSTLHANVATGIMLGKALRQRGCRTEGASIVLVSSVSALKYGGGTSAYAASKGAVIGATKAMAHEFLRDKIRVNCVIPATVESNMATKGRKTITEEAWNALIARHPMGMGTPDDVAHAVIYMLSDQTRWMTGTQLLVDGGFCIG